MTDQAKSLHGAGVLNRALRSGGRGVALLARRALSLPLAGLIGVVRLLPADFAIGLAGRLGRLIGMAHPRSRIGMDNLRASFPDKSEAELRSILIGSWDNTFRTSAEYLYLNELFDRDLATPDEARVETAGDAYFQQLRDDGKPGIVFTAHLGNWALLATCAARYGLETTALYRPPSNPVGAEILRRFVNRSLTQRVVASRPGAVYELMETLDAGGHVALLVDQKFLNRRHEIVTFFGRPAATNPLLAQLARRYDCPVHGARAVRLANGRHRLEITGPIELPRDEGGDIDVPRSTAMVAGIVEGWIREHPDQWLWLHRRWSL